MAEYFFELLTEEIPAWMHDAAQASLQQQLARLLEEVGAPGAPVSVTSTPRRFVLFLPNVPVRESERQEEIKGPPSRAANEAKGEPTHALAASLRQNSATAAAIRDRGDNVRFR